MSIKMQYKNLAMDPVIRARVEEELWGLLMPIRDNRQGREEKWKRHYRIYNCEFDNMSYKGFSKIYVSALRNAAEAIVGTLVRDIFPNGQWFKIKPNLHITSVLQAEMLSALMEHFFTKNMNLKSEMLPFMRQLVIYGTSPYKLIWKDDEKEIIAAELDKDEKGDWTRKFVKKLVKHFYGPYGRSVDLFNFFVYPETCADVTEADLVFEDMELSVQYITEMSKTPINKSKKDLGNIYYFDPSTDMDLLGTSPGYYRNLYQARAERLKQLGISKDPSDRWNKLAVDRRNVTELYWRRDLDGDGEKAWLVTVLNDCRVIRIQENPFNDKEPPYLVPRYIRIIGEFYGRGGFDGSDRLQYMANDVINQTMDSVQFRLNPITIMDPTKVRYAPSIKRAPGARWLADPTGFLETAPIDVSPTGFNAFNLVYGLIHDTSGASAALQGIPAARGRGRSQNTAGGMAQSLSQASLPLENQTEDFEEQFTKKLLKKTYSLMTQYMDDSILVRFLGGDATYLAKKVAIEDVIGDYEFEWLGVVSSRNKLVMGQQMLQFLNIVRALPPEVMAGLNWEYITSRIWTDGLGQRDSDEIFKANKSSFSVDPSLEFEMLQNNRDPVVMPADDDMGHAQKHLSDRNKIKDEELLKKWDQHIDDHFSQAAMKLEKQKEAQMMQQMQKVAAMQQMTQAGKPGGGKNGAQPARNAPQNQPTGMGQNGVSAAMQSLQGGVM